MERRATSKHPGILPAAIRFIAGSTIVTGLGQMVDQITEISPFAVEKVPMLNLHEVLCGPEGKSYAPLSQVVILWYELNSERG
jgi:hypothetical protein